MSASPMARQLTESKAIPTKRVVVTDPLDMPHEYSSTPGGTLYSTTPGGSRIVYERSFLIKLSESPISKTPPANFDIPEGLQRGAKTSPLQQHQQQNKSYKQHPVMSKKQPHQDHHHAGDDDEQFQMDM